MSQRICEDIVNVTVPQEQESACSHTVEQIVDVSALPFKETVEVSMAITQERISERNFQHIEVDTNAANQ